MPATAVTEGIVIQLWREVLEQGAETSRFGVFAVGFGRVKMHHLFPNQRLNTPAAGGVLIFNSILVDEDVGSDDFERRLERVFERQVLDRVVTENFPESSHTGLK